MEQYRTKDQKQGGPNRREKAERRMGLYLLLTVQTRPTAFQAEKDLEGAVAVVVQGFPHPECLVKWGIIPLKIIYLVMQF